MRTSTRLRWLERAFLALGISLIGGALGATWDRWSYQAEQQRIFLSSAPVETRAADEKKMIRDDVAEVLAPQPREAIQESRPAARNRNAGRADPDVLGRIEIPRLGVDAIVRVGADKKTLARAVGLVPGTARPGESGNVVLAGHRDTFFRPLRKIRVNDRIRLIVPPHEYEYRVDSMRVVSPEETSVLRSDGAESLTLVTCHPFYFVGPAPDRFIVSATRVGTQASVR